MSFFSLLPIGQIVVFEAKDTPSLSFQWDGLQFLDFRQKQLRPFTFLSRKKDTFAREGLREGLLKAKILSATMNVTITRTKAGRAKQLSCETIELPEQPATLDELLAALTAIGLQKAQETPEDIPLTAEQEAEQIAVGRVRFAERYGTDTNSLERALEIMRQDFKDGLFRVFIDKVEAAALEAPIQIGEGSEITLLKLVMLTGRLW